MSQETSDLVDAVAESDGCLYQLVIERAIHAYTKVKEIGSYQRHSSSCMLRR